MKYLLILNDPAHGTERSHNEIGCCGTCLDARGLTDDRLAEGARRSSLEELTAWTEWADRVITF